MLDDLSQAQDSDNDKEEDVNSEETVLQVDIDEETACGVYSNLTMSNFGKEEFVLDFVYIQPHLPKGKVRSRVILSPKNAKLLASMLQQNIAEYESKIGPLDDDAKPPAGFKLSFN